MSDHNNMFQSIPSQAAATTGSIGNAQNWADHQNRHTALAHAVAMNVGNEYRDEDVVETAEAFLVFLNGTATK